MKLFYLLFSLVYSEKIIRNINIPCCRNCVHYLPDNYGRDFTSTLSKCNQFGSKDIITDKITQDYADSCRRDETKCGEKGKYFEKETQWNLNLKLLKHGFISNIYMNVFTLYILLTIILTMKKYEK